MTYQDHIALGLADALLDGSPDVNGFAERMAEALGQKPEWIKPFARRIFRKFGNGLSYAQRARLIDFIKNDRGYSTARFGKVKLRIERYFTPVQSMHPRTGALAKCDLPDLPTQNDLAIWLGITAAELEWYADMRGMIRSTAGPLCHYNYKWIEKRYGYRLESPKFRLREIQRKILHEILDLVPAHSAAHGFRRGFSCLTYAAPHVGKDVVLRMDLRDFFISIPYPRINAMFRTLGYPEGTAKYLAGLCTNSVSGRVLFKTPKLAPGLETLWLERKKLMTRHLPQGAPTSPALANLCALRFDGRLSALARGLGADYTRYADDIAFSGDENFRRSVSRLGLLITKIAQDEGFQINFRKTRIMHRSDRQILTGMVVNEKINIRRKEYDQLKAILHNCLRFSPHSQNHQQHKDFHSHLLGRVNHVMQVNRSRGQKLKILFDRIEWK